MERLPLYLDGRTQGELTADTRGLYTCFTASCPLCPQLCRAYAVGEQGELRLGVLEPADGHLFLRRQVSARDVAAAGTLVRGEARWQEPEWKQVADPAQLFRAPFLQESLRGAQGALTRQQGKLRLLALPFDGHRPFLLTGLFCFAAVRQIDGRDYAVFTFDPNEQPIFP